MVWANAAAARLLGYAVDELSALTIDALLATPEAFDPRDRSTNGPHAFEGQLRLRNGESRWARLAGRPVAPDCPAAGTLWSIEDIHAARVAADALREFELHWQFALNVAGEGLWDWNLQTGTVFLSRSLQEMLGYADGELEGDADAWRERVHPQDRERLAAAQRPLLEGAASRYEVEHRLRTKGGEYRWIVDRCTVAGRRADGTPDRLIGVHIDIHERRLAQEALARRERHYRDMVTALPDILYAVAVDGSWGEYSPQVEAIFGVSAQVMARRPSLWRESIHPDDRPRCDAALLAAAAGRHFDVAYRLRDAHGRWRWVQDRSYDVREAGGRTIVRGVATDITQHRAALAAADLYQHLVECSADPLYVIDPAADFRFVYVNDAALRHLGYTRAQLLGMSPVDIDPQFRPGTGPELLDRVRAQGAQLIATVHRRADGREVPVEVSVSSVRLDGREHLAGCIRDVTARHDAERALRERDERFRKLAVEVPGFIYEFRVDANGWMSLPFASEGIRSIFGVTPDEVRRDARPAFSKVHPHDMAGVIATMQASARNLAPLLVEARVVLPDGSVRWRRAEGTPERAADGAILWYGYISDVHALKEAEAALRESEALYGSLVDAIPLCIYRTDLEGRIVFVNRALEQRMGRPLSALVGRIGYDFFGSERAARYRELDRRIVETGIEHHEIDEHVSRRTGLRSFLEITRVPVRDTEGRIAGIQGLFFDVTRRIEAEREIQLLANVFESSHQAIMITDAAPRILRVNAAFEAMTGYTEAEVRGRTPGILRADIRPRGFYEDMWRSLAATGRWHGELWNRRKDGSPYPEMLSIRVVRNQDGEVTHYVGQFADITERKATEARIEYLAHHDVVTELPNRALLADRAQVLLAHAARRRTKAGVLFLDLDRFKNVNDALGHDLGDELLREAGRRLSAAVRGADTVSRTGGDEFVILLAELQHPEDAGRIARTLQERLAEPFHLEGREASVTCSIGIALYPDNGRDLAELQRNADAAMYSAKARGRDRYCFYAPEMNERASDRLAVENDLRRALRGEEIFVDYQPQVNLATGQMVGVEALARWRHPERGLVSPASFIPIAEEAGLIVPLGERILEIACRMRRECWSQGHQAGVVAVNVSALQFREPRFIDTVERVLRDARLPPSLLELEVTESVLMHGADEVARTLNELSALGVSLAIDDFGTGYSSLSYLRHFPVRRLKIDQSFVREMTRDANSGAIVEAIVALGRVLGMSVVAEGVETSEQLRVLRGYGCDDGQGYFIRRPASGTEIAAMCAHDAFAHVRPAPA